MPYTILVNNNNTVTATERSRIMQRTKNVDNLRIIIPRVYENIDFSSYSVLMEYKLPISHEVKLEQLVLQPQTDEKYQGYMVFNLPLVTDFTKENGDVEIQLSLIGLSMDEEGNPMEIVRKIEPFRVPIIPISNWFTVPDSELDVLTQYYIAAQQQINALNDLVTIVNQSKADSINLDVVDGQLYLTSNGKKIGNSVSVEELGNEITERTSEGTVKINQ